MKNFKLYLSIPFLALLLSGCNYTNTFGDVSSSESNSSVDNSDGSSTSSSETSSSSSSDSSSSSSQGSSSFKFFKWRHNQCAARYYSRDC